MSIDDAVRTFLAQLADERRCSPRTVTSYRQELSLFSRWCAGRGVRVPSKVMREHLVTYLGPRTVGRVQITAATRNRKLTILRSFFSYLVGTRTVRKNPAKDVQFSRVSRKEQPSLTRAEVTHLLSSITDVVPWRKARDRCLIAVLFNTGLRLDELLSLDVDQVDLDNALLHDVRRKGGSEQPLPLNGAAVDALKTWLAERKKAGGTSGPLFISRRQKRLSGRAVQARIKEIGKDSGFPYLHPHLLRHSFATELLATGANLEEVRRLMGHTSIVTTSRYSHPDQEALRRAVARLGPERSRK